jgi:trans-2,3-dihydro-3-hydroxyanthranilate isomerase
MAELSYLTLDVFTDRRFGGNQLAVFPDASGLPDATMQAIARELNLSETIFLSPARPGQEWNARIFTPGMELPFAGHPTIGAAIALSLLGRVESDRIVLHEPAGPVPVRLFESGGTPAAVLSTPQLPRPVSLVLAEPAALASMLGLSPSDIGPVAPAAYSAGVPFTFIPVRSRTLLDRAVLDVPNWAIHVGSTAAPHVAVLSLEDWEQGTEVHLRMFAPAMGIAEDPATGAAAAALAGLLARIQRVPDGTGKWRIIQGVRMGRPSIIQLEADVAAGAVAAVRVGGQAVLMSRATMEID